MKTFFATLYVFFGQTKCWAKGLRTLLALMYPKNKFSTHLFHTYSRTSKNHLFDDKMDFGC